MPNYDQPGIFYDQPGLFYDAPAAAPERKRMAKIKLEIYHMTIDDEIAYLGPIVTKMTGNAAFTTLATKTTALGTATTALSTANADYLAAVQTAEQKLTLRDTARTTAENAARALATGAESITTDAATLQSGGWDLQADRAPVGPLPQPANLAASGGDLDGTVDLAWDAIRRGVQSYVAEQATAPSGPWTQCYVGKSSKCTVTGLTSGTQYWFRVKAIGAAGPSAWSDPATKRAT